MRDSYADSEREWSELFDLHFNHLVLYVNNYIGSVAVSEDIIQDLFIKLWQKRNSVTITPSFLFVCARNSALTYLRLNKRKFIPPDDIVLREVSDSFMVDEEIAYIDRLEEVRTAITKLSPQCREVLKKIYFENKKYAEVAEEMNLSLNTIKSHIYLAIKVLRGNFLFFVLFLNH